MLPDFMLTFFRSIMAFFTLLILARLLGKKQVGQLTFFEYVLGITVGSISANMSTNLTNRALPEFTGLVTWVILTLLVQLIALKSRKLAKITDGEPTILIQNGKIMEDKLSTNYYRFDELMKQLREKDVFNISEVEFAILETDGTLSVLKKSQVQPVTPADLNLATNYHGMSIELIYEGKIITQNLSQIKKDEQWLQTQLKKRGITLDQVTFGSIDTNGLLYLDLYKDQDIDIVDPSDYDGPS